MKSFHMELKLDINEEWLTTYSFVQQLFIEYWLYSEAKGYGDEMVLSLLMVG